MQLQQRQLLANKRYFVNISRDDANDGIISNLKAALGWHADIAGCARVGGNGFEAFNKVIVKANVASIADTPLIGDFLVSINEDLPLTFESKPLRILGAFYRMVNKKRAAEIITKTSRLEQLHQPLVYSVAEKFQQTPQSCSYYSKAAPVGQRYHKDSA